VHTSRISKISTGLVINDQMVCYFNFTGCLVLNTGKPRFNESEGTKYFVIYNRGLFLLGLFTIKLTTEALEIKFFIAGILILEGSLYQGFSVS
jgi:hypothetical protein